MAYQVLARYLDVSYFDNLTALFPRSPITGRSMFPRLSQKHMVKFESYYGNSAGWRAPNDGFHIWNRWLGEDRYRAPAVLEPSKVASMHRFFCAWEKKFHKPLLNKNNRNTDCVDLLKDALPNVVFVEIRRDPVFIAQSLLRARAEIQGDSRVGWGLGSQNLGEGASRLEVIDSVCDQVEEIMARLDGYRSTIDPEHYISTSYEEFCDDPKGLVQGMVDRIPDLKLREDSRLEELAPFELRNRQRLPDSEFARISHRFCY